MYQVWKPASLITQRKSHLCQEIEKVSLTYFTTGKERKDRKRKIIWTDTHLFLFIKQLYISINKKVFNPSKN